MSIHVLPRAWPHGKLFGRLFGCPLGYPFGFDFLLFVCFLFLVPLTKLNTDASYFAVGAVFSQEKQGLMETNFKLIFFLEIKMS